MKLHLGQCCISWGVEYPEDVEITPWQVYMDEASACGYHGIELGPIGYLPTDPTQLRDELQRRGLQLCAGYVMERLADLEAHEQTLTRARETAELLAAAGARHLVLIDEMYPERTAVAGNSDAASRLDPDRFEGLVSTAEAVARIAVDDFGLEVAFHPHAGSYVEFQDEIDQFLAMADPTLVRLCLDTGHSAYAGVDPVELFETCSDRVGYMHLKDVNPAVRHRTRSEGLGFEKAVGEGIFCPLGQGEVDYPTLFGRMAAAGYQGWISIEQDRLPRLETGSRTSFADDARASLEYIAALGHVAPTGEQSTPDPA